MATIPSAVTATGSDRSRLLADLTMRLGRIDVISEREVTLPDGNPGWEVTVRHQPFVADEAQQAEVEDLTERIEELRREAAGCPRRGARGASRAGRGRAGRGRADRGGGA